MAKSFYEMTANEVLSDVNRFLVASRIYCTHGKQRVMCAICSLAEAATKSIPYPAHYS